MNIYLENHVWIRVVDNREGKYSDKYEKGILNKETDNILLQHPHLFHGESDVGLRWIDADNPPVPGNYIYEVQNDKIKTKVRSFGSPITRVEGRIEVLD